MPLTLTDEELIDGLKRHGSAYMLAQAANGRFLLTDAARSINSHIANTNRPAFRLRKEDCGYEPHRHLARQ